jgi:hypothetical protein
VSRTRKDTKAYREAGAKLTGWFAFGHGPPGWFRRIRRQRERARARDALARGEEPQPFKRRDLCDWW